MNTTRPDHAASIPNLGTDPRFIGLVEAARALQPKTVALRRQLHKNPEEGLQLPKTQAAILHAIEDLDLEVTTGKTTTSVVAVLRGAKPGPTVLLRGDMDALPLTEETGLPFASEVDGKMHACGHDTHVAMLASAARVLSSRKGALAGNVVFMFQPGEEGQHGARYMIHEGVLKAAGDDVARAFALHITSKEPSGVVVCRPGPMMAAADTFHVRITGKGGHGASPHDAVDPIPAAAAMVGALQTMLGRRVSVFEPAVITVGRIQAGTATNIIPETAEMEGTIRSLSEATRSFVHTELARICEHVGAAHDCRVLVDITPGYPVTVNDHDVALGAVKLAQTVLGQRCGKVMADPMMGAEDFSYVLQRVPGAMAFLGACPPDVEPDEAPPNHSNRVHFDESALTNGVAMYSAFALDALRATG
ncbi:M20 metallopeptidase family protein [Labedaea rhizosphaerae]|uniref:Hippurate hydrolase n=1 Tax=Labedaea rhizosphaerae TaxID=598644 RepID=A0A4R6SL25_LABRH|nr:M20 family metallopeptidase [Labedaea rhizosphaerae]TDQ04878.1 hippurate hydrolase [Labedaea rhizosphaerae]